MLQRPATNAAGADRPGAPVELLSREPRGPLSKVLIPVDLSDASERAVRWALKQPGSNKTLRVLLCCEAPDCDAADFVRFLGRFADKQQALIHSQIFTGGEQGLCDLIREEKIQKIVVGVGDDASSESGALAQRLARLCPCGVVTVPRREPVRELLRIDPGAPTKD